MIFSIDKLECVPNYAVYKHRLEVVAFPTESIEVIDALQWIENHILEKDRLDFSKIFCDWRTYIGMESIEIEKFNEVFQIENSNLILKSFDIDLSFQIRESENIRLSSYVDGGKQIQNSEKIYGSMDIINSCYIRNSSHIKNSFEIDGSSIVENSQNVFNSDDVSTSFGVYSCENINNSIGVFDSEGGTELYFSTNLTNCSYCLFCSSLKDKEFYIFNQPIEPKNWFVIKELLLNEWSEEDRNIYKIISFETDKNEWCGFRRETKICAGFSYVAQRNFFQNISPKFLKCIRSMPYYNEWLLYQITLNSKILEE